MEGDERTKKWARYIWLHRCWAAWQNGGKRATPPLPSSRVGLAWDYCFLLSFLHSCLHAMLSLTLRHPVLHWCLHNLRAVQSQSYIVLLVDHHYGKQNSFLFTILSPISLLIVTRLPIGVQSFQYASTQYRGVTQKSGFYPVNGQSLSQPSIDGRIDTCILPFTVTRLHTLLFQYSRIWWGEAPPEQT